MKMITALVALAVILSSCQKKQFYKESAEIDLVKKGNAAYLAGDWEGLRAMYADTATVVVNGWMGDEMSVDKFLEMQKQQLEAVSAYSISDDGFYEMIENENGEHWVHAWIRWTGKYKTGKDVNVTVNITAQVVNGKIVWFGIIADNLAGYLAQQPDSTMVMK